MRSSPAAAASLLQPGEEGLGVALRSLAAAFSPLVSHGSSNFLGGLCYPDGLRPSCHFLCHSDVKEYFAPWYVYINSGQLFPPFYKFL